MNLQNLEKTIGYSFKNKNSLKQALTHSSFANEQRSMSVSHNERIEFLGDAVLELCISEHIYSEYPEMPEGDMTRLRAGIVCEPSLAKKAKDIGLGELLIMGRGEELTGGRNRDSILCDAIEAVIGAVYLDGGYNEAKKLVKFLLSEEVEHLSKNFWRWDCKTFLQEHIQRESKTPLVYSVVKETGPDHEKFFVVELTHVGKKLGWGKGKNKKEAEQNAALDAIKNLKLK